MSNVRTNTPRETTEMSLLSDPGDVFKNPLQLTFIRTLVEILRRVTGNAVRRDQATPQIILTAPNGMAFIVSVANDGTIVSRRADRNDRGFDA